VGVYVLAWFPAFLCFLAVIGFNLRREQKAICALQEEVALGTLTPEEVALATSPARRLGFERKALRSGGFANYRSARAFFRTAIRLALSKWHSLRAVAREGGTRSLPKIHQLRQLLADRRSQIRRQ